MIFLKLVLIASVTVSLSTFVAVKQEAYANYWTPWFSCGQSNIFAYQGYYWYINQYCENYYVNGNLCTNCFLEEQLQKQLWYRYIGYWQPHHYVGPYISYWCNPQTQDGWYGGPNGVTQYVYPCGSI